MEYGSIRSLFRLDDCVGCRACSEVCPSYRNGGIDPQYTISAVVNEGEVKDIWTCLVCHRCAMICIQKLNVTGMMLALRELDVKEGNAPDKIKKMSSTLTNDGKLSIPRGRMETLRKDLGLTEIAEDQKAISELNEIMNITGNSND